MNIGKNIRHIRKEKKLTQKELGEKLGGISQQQIGQWENGNKTPKLETIIKIAAALNIPLFEIISVDEYNSLIKSKVDEQIQSNIKNGRMHIVTPDEQELTTNYLKLNTSGKNEARKRVEELTEIPRYTKPEE